MIWAILAIMAIIALFAFGATMFRAGRKNAENQAFRAKDKENEKVDKVIQRTAPLERDELLRRLRDGKDE